MAGFLDKNDRVVDMILTADGRRLLSQGKLNFVYYAFMDDEVDYDPYIATSANLTAEQMSSSWSEQVEASLVKEAIGGRTGDPDRVNRLNGTSRLYTQPQGQGFLSKMVLTPDSFSGSIQLDQRRIQEMRTRKDETGHVISVLGPFDRGYERISTQTFPIEYDVRDFFGTQRQEGFLLRIMQSGSNGLVELPAKRDFANEIAYTPDLAMDIITHEEE